MKIAFSQKIHSNNHDPKTNTPIDYDIYAMTLKDRLLYMALGSAALFAVGLIFYHSIPFSLSLCALGLFYPRIRIKELIRRRKNELNIQFKDALYALSASLAAGRSLELALKDVLRDLSVIYPNPDTYIIAEIELAVKRIEMNETVEEALADFARRSHVEDIESFVDVLYISKRAGGNILEVIKNTSNIISDKIEIRQEIDIMLSQRKLEHKILNILPIGMILLLTVSAEDYMNPVFSDPVGRVAMTFSLILLGTAYFISKKIMDIKV